MIPEPAERIRPADMSAVAGRPLIVELTGLPGAGKTTIARLLPPALSSRGYRCGDRNLVRGRTFGQGRMPYGDLARFYLSQGAVVRSTLRLGLARPPLHAARTREVLKLLFWSYRLQVARRTDNDVVVLDQGVLQQAWSTVARGDVRYGPAVREAVRSLMLAAGVPFVLILVHTDVPLALERLQHRPTMRSTFDRMSVAEAAPRLAVQQRGLASLFRDAVSDVGAAGLTLDGTLSPGENCRLAVDFIEGTIRSRATGAPTASRESAAGRPQGDLREPAARRGVP